MLSFNILYPILYSISYLMGTQFTSFAEFRQRYRREQMLQEDDQQTFVVYDLKLNKLKRERVISLPPEAQSDKYLQKLQRMIKLQHPSLVAVEDFFLQLTSELPYSPFVQMNSKNNQTNLLSKQDSSKTLHIITEYVELVPLSDYMGKLDKVVLGTYEQIKSALFYLHDQNLSQKQICLDSLSIDRNHTIKISDYGLFVDELNMKLSKNQIKGPPCYRSPELSKQNSKVGLCSNLWALGIVLLELAMNQRISQLLQKNPYEDFNLNGLIANSNISRQLQQILIPLLSRDEKTRTMLVKQEDEKISFLCIKSKYPLTRNMKMLSLHDCGIQKSGAFEIGDKLPNLIYLDLKNNHIGRDGTAEIARRLRKLKVLKLANNNVHVQGTKQIARYQSNLEVLDLSGNYVKQGSIDIARSMKALRQLTFYWNTINDDQVRQIASYLKELKFLDLSGNHIYKQGAQEISKNLKNVTHLNLATNYIDNQGALLITTLPNLQMLNIGNNYLDQQCKAEIKRRLKGKSVWV